MKGTVRERFEAKVQKDDFGCWIWTASRLRNGYGRFAPVRTKAEYAHRVAYELYVGPIPLGLEVDHVCHNAAADCSGGFTCLHRACVRPDHLRAVTHRENSISGKSIVAVLAAMTHCAKGHPFDESNTYVAPSGYRRCRTCAREYDRQRVRHRRNAGLDLFTPWGAT
jgi:hypothetical protein